MLKSHIFNDNIINHGFFSKHGGCSTDLYKSMNCSYVVGDDDRNVQDNLRKIKESMNAEVLFSLHQVHGNRAVLIDENSDLQQCNQTIDADAMVTKMPKICLGILTADCAPVLLYEKNSDIVAAMHCGWKSARFGVIENTVSLISSMTNRSLELVAAIGPCVHVDSYIVQQDFVCEFEPEPFAKQCFVKLDGEIHFDLVSYVKHKLINAGVKGVDVIDQDTVKNEEDFFSFRIAKQRTSGVCGRQISCIMIK